MTAVAGDRSQLALVNLTGEPVRVLVDGRLVTLVEAPPPQLLHHPEPSGSRRLLVVAEAASGERGQPGVADLQMFDREAVLGILRVPPVLDGVLWLVTADAKAAFPSRDDFVCPALYGFLPDEGPKPGKKGKGKKGKGKKRKRSPVEGFERSYLVGVTRDPSAAAGPDTKLVDFADDEEGSQADLA